MNGDREILLASPIMNNPQITQTHADFPLINPSILWLDREGSDDRTSLNWQPTGAPPIGLLSLFGCSNSRRW
jgi:hypothetical protein